ncbi:MAG TPA: hypothetical protein VHZ03_49820 [Trebonia sp.]|jgi:hypothetical protein|nr:hypothetical protein [Trebonia sp.]
MDEWVAKASGNPGEPWASFERARRLARAGKRGEAAEVWRQIADADGLESRHILQAWHFLRQAGYQPAADQAAQVLGAVAEMPITNAHDLLAAYSDGTARYFNYSGKALIWDIQTDVRVLGGVMDWFASAQVIARSVGVWEKPSLPPLPGGHFRLAVLTPGGVRFGQGPVKDMPTG